MPFLLPPCAHLEVLLEANGQYLGHGWGRAPRGRGAGQGRAVKRDCRRCSPHGGRSGAGAEPSLGWRPARPPLSSASVRGRSLARITPHLSLPGSPQIVPPCRASPSAHRRRLSPALTLPPDSAPLSLTPAEGTGWGRGCEERVVPAAATASGEGREGLSECRYPSAAATHAHVTRPPPRPPPALPPADPHPGPELLLTPPHPDPPGLFPTRPHTGPPGSLPAHPHTGPRGFSLPFPSPQPLGGAGASLHSTPRDSRRR